jgi:hypothetical protein
MGFPGQIRTVLAEDMVFIHNFNVPWAFLHRKGLG